MMLTALAEIARTTGCPVVEVDGWQTRGDGVMLGVKTITCHHTANGGAGGNMPSLAVVRDGRAGLPGPLAQYGLGKDGTIYVVAAGKCNHAGVSLKTEYTNSYAIGIEAEADGVPGVKDDWPAIQMTAYHRLCRALVAHYGLDVADVRGHKETCSPVGRKTDPDFSMSEFRLAVSAVDLSEGAPMELSDEVKYTTSAKARIGKTQDTVSMILQWPPAVRFARDEIAVARAEAAAQFGALNATIATLAAHLGTGATLTAAEVEAAAAAGATKALAALKK
jgi:hypothetical protein